VTTTNPYAEVKVYSESGRRLCGVEGCTLLHNARGLCKAHGARLKQSGDVRADVPVKLVKSSPRKGSSISYPAAHHRVTKENGPASGYACACGCGRAATDWAYLGTAGDGEKVSHDKTTKGMRYGTDPDAYVPLARDCHKRLDGWQAKRREGALSLAEMLSPFACCAA
jgi:hypothetical protein